MGFGLGFCCCDPCREFDTLSGGLTGSTSLDFTASNPEREVTRGPCNRSFFSGSAIRNGGEVTDPPSILGLGSLPHEASFVPKNDVVYTLNSDIVGELEISEAGLVSRASYSTSIRMGDDSSISQLIGGANYFESESADISFTENLCSANGLVPLDEPAPDSGNVFRHIVGKTPITRSSSQGRSNSSIFVGAIEIDDEVPLGRLSAAVIRRGQEITVYQCFEEGGDWVEVQTYEGCHVYIHWFVRGSATSGNTNREPAFAHEATEASVSIGGTWTLTETDSSELPDTHIS